MAWPPAATQHSRNRANQLHPRATGRQRWLYSFDMLLPVMHLRHHHAEVQLEWVWARVYLYIHKIMGYVLIALLLAAITAGNQID